MLQRPPRTPFVQPDQIDHHISDMTLTAGAQVTLEMIQRAINPHRQWLPLDGNPTEPLAGLAVKMSTGPLRLGFGAWRDLTLGVQFEDGSGKLLTAGGRVMKNVAGYDLTKMFVGSHGQFGRLVSITFRTYKLPQLVLHVTLPIDFPIHSWLHTDLKPHWMIREENSIRVGFMGDESAIHFYESRLGESKLHGTRVSLQDDINLRHELWSKRNDLRASIPPGNIERFLQSISLADFAIDPAHGIVVARKPFDFAHVQANTKEVGGWAMEFDERGDPKQLPSQGLPPDIFKKIRDAFDPDCKLQHVPIGS